MSSVECLREFINARLAAAAEEIFGVFIETIEGYQEEIDRLRKLLDMAWNPNIKLHRIGVCGLNQWWKVTKYIYSSTVLKYNFQLLIL